MEKILQVTLIFILLILTSSIHAKAQSAFEGAYGQLGIGYSGFAPSNIVSNSYIYNNATN